MKDKYLTSLFPKKRALEPFIFKDVCKKRENTSAYFGLQILSSEISNPYLKTHFCFLRNSSYATQRAAQRPFKNWGCHFPGRCKPAGLELRVCAGCERVTKLRVRWTKRASNPPCSAGRQPPGEARVGKVQPGTPSIQDSGTLTAQPSLLWVPRKPTSPEVSWHHVKRPPTNLFFTLQQIIYMTEKPC